MTCLSKYRKYIDSFEKLELINEDLITHNLRVPSEGTSYVISDASRDMSAYIVYDAIDFEESEHLQFLSSTNVNILTLKNTYMFVLQLVIFG